MPDGAYLECDAETVSTGASTAGETIQSMAKMVDWSIGLHLAEDDMDTVNSAFRQVRHNEASLNQSLSFIRCCPLFLDIEIKKTQSNVNPEVQLAIWAAAALQKRHLHGWDTDTAMPMPAIAVNGHIWTYYLFYESQGELVCISFVGLMSRVQADVCLTDNDGSLATWLYGGSKGGMGDLLSTQYTHRVGYARVQGLVW